MVKRNFSGKRFFFPLPVDLVLSLFQDFYNYPIVINLSLKLNQITLSLSPTFSISFIW